MPAGDTVQVGDWAITVLSVTPDATDAVHAENQYNDPPAENHQFFFIEVATTYVGQESEALFAGLTFTALGDSSVAYDFEAYCGVIPNAIDDFTEVFPGGTLQGNLCWQVATNDVDSLVLIVDPAFSFNNERVFLEIPPPGVDFDPPSATTSGVEGGEPGSRGNPLPAGDRVQIGDWEITVLSTTPNATEAVQAENQYNDPPAENHQFFFVEIATTYVGQESESLFAGLTFTALGDSSVAYDFEAYCGVIPNPIDDFTEVFPGGTLQGNLCWSVATDDLDSLVLIVDPAFSFDDERVYLALR